MSERQSQVQTYYGETLTSTASLKTTACCDLDALPGYVKPLLANVAPEVLEKYYGCGTAIPPALEGCSVLDLGSGSGRDVYVCAQLTGETGHVTGIDMTDAQLKVARDHEEAMRVAFGYSASNVTFVKGVIEDVAAAGVRDDSQDVVISNCVINLSEDKPAVYRGIFNALKPGGEMYISDVFASRRVPEPLQKDPVLVGECLSGAMYIEDFRRLMADIGVLDYRVVTSRVLDITDAEIAAKLEPITFYSMTIRAFKLDLEDRCEDYGQVAIYKGGIMECPTLFTLDDHHVFEKGKPMLVCGNTADMLSQTRYAPYFDVIGAKDLHFGLFDCSDDVTAASGVASVKDDVGACC